MRCEDKKEVQAEQDVRLGGPGLSNRNRACSVWLCVRDLTGCSRSPISQCLTLLLAHGLYTPVHILTSCLVSRFIGFYWLLCGKGKFDALLDGTVEAQSLWLSPWVIPIFIVSGCLSPLPPSSRLQDQGQMASPWEAFSNFRSQRQFSLSSVHALTLTLFMFIFCNNLFWTLSFVRILINIPSFWGLYTNGVAGGILFVDMRFVLFLFWIYKMEVATENV